MSWPPKIPKDPRLQIRVGQRLASGPLLRLSNFSEIIYGISNLSRVAEFKEVELAGIDGAPPTYVLAKTLLEFPQVCVGYHESGLPILLGVTRVLQGHMSLLGQTRSGKTTFVAVMALQLIRLGFPFIALANKTHDPMIYSPMSAAAEADTRRDAQGNPETVPFRYATLGPGLKTSGVNYVEQMSRDHYPLLLKAGNLMQALNQGAPMDDRAGQFFAMSGLELLQATPWGNSFQDLIASIQQMRLNRDTAYSTAGVRNVLSQIASLPLLNLPSDHPSNVDLEWLIRKNGAFYFEGSGQEVGDLGTVGTGLVFQAIISAKRRVDPTNKKMLFLFIDEAQLFPRTLLRRGIEQAAGAKIRIIFAAHSAEQFGQDYETIASTGVSVFFSAVPGSSTEHYLQASFGTKKTYALSIGQSDGKTFGEGISDGPQGQTVSKNWGKQQGNNFGLVEKEVPAFSTDDLKTLNDNQRAFVIRVAPRDELVTFGAGAQRASSGGAPMSFPEIDRLALRVFEDSPHTFLPGREQPKKLSGPEPKVGSPGRAMLLQKLERAAARIKQSL